MATRSKNSFLYSITFTLAVLLLGYTVLVTASLGINYEYISKASYFKSHLFLFSLDLYSSDLNQYYTTYKDYPQKTDVQKISEEDIKNAVDANENYVKDGTAQIEEKYRYLTESTDRTKEERDAAVKQRDAELEKYRKDNTKTEELIRKELVEEKDKNYIDLKNSIDARGGIKYYLTFRSTGEVCTNLSITSGIDNYISENNLLYWDRYPKEITSKEEQDYDRINENLLRADLQGYFIVPKNMENYSSIYNENAFFNSTRIRLINEAIAGAAAFFISIVLFFITSRRKDKEEAVLNKLAAAYIKLPLELRVGILLIITIGYFAVVNETNGQLLNLPLPAYALFSMLTSGYMLYIMLHLRGIYNLITNSENFKAQTKGTILYRISSMCYRLILFRNTMLKLFILIAASMIFGICLLGLTVVDDGFMGLFLVIYIIGYLFFIWKKAIKKAIYFNELVKGTEQAAAGNFDYVIEEKGSGLTKLLAHNFNNIKNGFKRSIDSQVRSERLKTELITNVSHDLKTPLTSIINYVDLLKNKELTEEEKDGYIVVLDKKAQRLKVLIEDLFEASKMTSGSVELNIDKVEITALLRQSLGEFDEKISSSSLTFRVSLPDEKVYLTLDGKKTWRVFENLINNALKYSQPNTRVYINLQEMEGKVRITVKNIAGYEMDFDAEEIFERFKRGDKSRNTEGSGLGLAIARSIVELQGGTMKIEMDGDLFKVIVEFSKY